MMNPKIRLTRTIGRPALGGVLIFLFLVFVSQLSLHFGLTGWRNILDDLAGGVIAGLLLYLDERRRQRRLAERLQIIASMNHHVRNALQAIKYARYTPDDVRVIEEAAARIEWALREVLPGEKEPAELEKFAARL